MRWYVDTHKFMSEVTRKALQIMSAHGITSQSDQNEIDTVERELADNGIYRGYSNSEGRVRRALFTYFKAYWCLDDKEQLTELGKAFVENGLSIREFNFCYVLNYLFEEDKTKYYPVFFILKCLKKMEEISPEQAYLTIDNFEWLSNCNSEEEINDEFVRKLISRHDEMIEEPNARNVGFDVWAKLLCDAGILKKNVNRNLIISNPELTDWIINAYSNTFEVEKGKLLTGILDYIPVLPVGHALGENKQFSEETKALRAFLFETIDDRINRTYICQSKADDFDKMLEAFGLDETMKGFYSAFRGLENIVGYKLRENNNELIRELGKNIISNEINDANEETSYEEIRKLPSVVKDCAKEIMDKIYSIDGFSRICERFLVLEKSIGINTRNGILSVERALLPNVFILPESAVYNQPLRVYVEKDYVIRIGEKTVSCRLTNQWKGTSVTEDDLTNNNLPALIAVINKYYPDWLEIIKKAGSYYMVIRRRTFRIEDLPESFDSDYSRRFIISLLSKPFVILTGNSGTGKTRIAKQFAQYLQEDDENGEKNWLIAPVGADWTDNSRIMGFFNPLAENGKGRYVKTDILELIERANAHPNIPYFLILDEMNLSHVERYFSDFLSHMETPDVPFEIDNYGTFAYPRNLFVVGTVNIDETTYMFSPKVLDRANVIEFKPNKEDVLKMFGISSFIDCTSRALAGTAEAFLLLAKDVRKGRNKADSEAESAFSEIYDIVEKKGFEFAYRTVKEICLYIDAAHRLSDKWENEERYKAIDEQLLQKVLPKIHGNRKEIGEMLDELAAVCNQEGKKLECSLKKIEQMKGRLASVQYASFI